MNSRPQSLIIKMVERGFIAEKNAFGDERPATFAFETLDSLLGFLREFYAVVSKEREAEEKYDREHRPV